MLDRSDFPIFQRRVHGYRLAYLDSAATTQKPQVVIDAIDRYYTYSNSNVHRGLHTLSSEATKAFEEGRVVIGTWINAKHPESEIIFTKGATEALNLAAWGIGAKITAGDEILVSALEHHANIIPWQQVAKRTGAILKQIPINSLGEIDLQKYLELLSEKTKVVAVNAMSNTLGTINPVQEMAQAAHMFGAVLVCDATQMAAHFVLDVQDLDCDVLAMSGHKMYGPTGIGLCYAKKDLMEQWDVYQTGGEMIEHVTFESASYKLAPYKFEAGTPNIAGVIGWTAAINYMRPLMPELKAHELSLIKLLDAGLDAIPGITRYSCAKNKTAIASFAVDNCHPQDVAIMLDTFGVAVRSGHHCTMPLLQLLGVNGLVRASLAAYTEEADILQLLDALPKVKSMCVF